MPSTTLKEISDFYSLKRIHLDGSEHLKGMLRLFGLQHWMQVRPQIQHSNHHSRNRHVGETTVLYGRVIKSLASLLSVPTT